MRGLVRMGALAVLWIGCGEGADTPTMDEQLQGAWGLLSEAQACVQTFEFDDGSFAMTQLCELEGGGYGVERYEGTYVVGEEDELVLTVDRSSCARSTVQMSATLSFPGENLRLTTPSGVLLLKRVPAEPDTGDAELVFGCFDDESAFAHGVLRAAR